MKVSLILLLPGLLFGAVPECRLFGAEVRARIIDGFGRPLSEAAVEVKLTEKGADGKVTRVHWLKLLSNQDGLVKGDFDEKLADTSSVYVSKEGYTGYTTDLRAEYVLQRKFGPKDIRRIANLRGEAQRTELRQVLAGEFENNDSSEGLLELMFFYERQLRSQLRSLVEDARVGAAAAGVLAFIGVPEDLRLVIQHAPPPKRELFKDRWVYGVVCALLEPGSEEEWVFLKQCALNVYDDLWVDAGAINVLRSIASPRSLQVLREAKEKNTDRADMIARAAEYIQSNPPPLWHTNLVEAGKRAAQALKIGSWEENKEPRFNDDGDKAIIECEFIAGRDRLIHTATFHQVGGLWKLRGVRETLQALLANPPDRKVFIGAWHGYSESHLEFGRLELKENGTGLFAISYLPNSPPSIYRVTQWLQKRFNLDITVESEEPDAEPITLQNVTHGIDSLEFELHGKGWNRKMTLLNETEFQGRADAAKRSLEDLLKLK